MANLPDSKDPSAEIWSRFATDDLDREDGAVKAAVRYTPRNLVGRALLAIARRRIFSYAEADRPKLEWLKRAMSDTGPLLLDVGVRTGDLAMLFKQWGKRVHGIDIAETYVEHCRSKSIIEHGAACNVETDSLPTPSSFDAALPAGYDVVFLGEILEHLLNARDVLRKAAEICRPGGAIIITTPNLAYLGNRVRLLLGRDLHPLTIDRGEVGHQHIRVYTARLLTRLFEHAGCRVVDVGSDGMPVSLERFIAVEGGPRRLSGDQTIAPAQLIVPLTRRPIATLGRTIFVKAVRADPA